MESRNPIAIIFFTLVIDLIGFAMLIPIIPQLLANPQSNFFILPDRMALSSGYILLGFLLAIFPFAQFLATPVLGQLSDRFGRKKLIALSILGTCISNVIFIAGLITKNIPILFIARAFAGFTGGNIAVAQASVADVTMPENRSKSFGLIGGAMGLGIIIGPTIGGKLSDPNIVNWFNVTIPFWFVAILAALNFIFVLLFFPETLTGPIRKEKIILSRSFKNILRAYSFPNLRINFSSHFLFQLGWAFFLTFISVVMIYRFNYTQGNIGNYFSFIGVCVAISQIFLTRLISKKFSDGNVLRVSYLGAAITVLCYFLSTNTSQLYLIGILGAPWIAFSQTFGPGLISRSVNSNIQGEILGVTASIQGLAQSIPPILGGYIASRLSPEFPILLSSIVITIGGLVFIFFYKSPINKLNGKFK